MIKNDKQTLGEFIQEVRKEKGVSIDEIVRETNMSKKYLESIEQDNFTVFPGETYAMGFISNYADVLEINRDTAVSMYKRQMKIEQDSPIEQLVGKKKQTININNSIIIIGVTAIVLLLILIISQLTKNTNNIKPVENYQPVNYFYNFNEITNSANQKFRMGDTINISNENRLVVINLLNISAGNNLQLKINNNDYSIKAGGHINLDSDLNGTNDMGIDVFSVKGKEIKLSIVGAKEIVISNEIVTSDELYNKYKQYILTENELMSSSAKTTVTVKLSFSGTSWINYASDGKDEKESVMYNGNSMNCSFENNMVLYMANAGAVKISVGNKEEMGGGAGEAGKSIFFWRNKNGQYYLIRAYLK